MSKLFHLLDMASFYPFRFPGFLHTLRGGKSLFLLAPLLIFLFFPGRAFCFPSIGRAPQEVSDQFLPEGKDFGVGVWAEGLEIPWSLLFLPGGRALVGERPGRIRLVQDGELREAPYVTVEVAHVGEGGLLGLARHPGFPEMPFIYAMHTYSRAGQLYNRVVRFKDLGAKGIFDRVIIDQIPGGRFHNGGRIAFGPDGMLYITAGETFEGNLAQDLKSLGGKY